MMNNNTETIMMMANNTTNNYHHHQLDNTHSLPNNDEEFMEQQCPSLLIHFLDSQSGIKRRIIQDLTWDMYTYEGLVQSLAALKNGGNCTSSMVQPIDSSPLYIRYTIGSGCSAHRKLIIGNDSDWQSTLHQLLESEFTTINLFVCTSPNEYHHHHHHHHHDDDHDDNDDEHFEHKKRSLTTEEKFEKSVEKLNRKHKKNLKKKDNFKRKLEKLAEQNHLVKKLHHHHHHHRHSKKAVHHHDKEDNSFPKQLFIDGSSMLLSLSELKELALKKNEKQTAENIIIDLSKDLLRSGPFELVHVCFNSNMNITPENQNDTFVVSVASTFSNTSDLIVESANKQIIAGNLESCLIVSNDRVLRREMNNLGVKFCSVKSLIKYCCQLDHDSTNNNRSRCEKTKEWLSHLIHSHSN